MRERLERISSTKGAAGVFAAGTINALEAVASGESFDAYLLATRYDEKGFTPNAARKISAAIARGSLSPALLERIRCWNQELNEPLPETGLARWISLQTFTRATTHARQRIQVTPRDFLVVNVLPWYFGSLRAASGKKDGVALIGDCLRVLRPGGTLVANLLGAKWGH